MMIAACFIYILRQNARSPLFRVQLDGQRFIHLRVRLTTFSGPRSSDAANRFEIHRRHSSRVRAIAAPHQRAVSRLICMKQRFSHSRGSASKACRHQAWRAIILMSNNTERVDRLGETFTLITQHLSGRLKKRLIGID
jgi:hypothetical protein